MILFLYGADTYRSHQKLEEIRAKFLRDVDGSGMNLTVLDGALSGPDEIQAAISAAPFLAKKRLVILKNALTSAKKKTQQELAALFERVPEETVLTVYEAEGAKELEGNAAFETVRKGKYFPEYTPLPPKQMAEWIRAEAKARGAEFTTEALATYSALAGNDLWKVASEIDKLSAHALSAGTRIDHAAIDLLADVRVETTIFEFLDAIGARRQDRAASLLEHLLEQGESEVAIVNRLQGHFRNLLVCSDMGETGQLSKERLARELGVHPFVASKALSQCRYFSRDELTRLYTWLIDADERLKVGGWPKPRMAIDMFILQAHKS